MPFLNNMVTGVYQKDSRKNLKCAGLDTVHNFKDQNLFWLLGKSHPDEVEALKGITLNFQTQQQSPPLLAEFQKQRSWSNSQLRT